MTLPPVISIVLRLLPCLIPPYALRLNRVFGTKRVGWVLFAAFSLLAIVQLMRAWQPSWSLDPGITLDLLSFLVPVLLLVSMVHIETLFRGRLRLEEEEKKLRADLENQVRQRTIDLDRANDELQREITLRKQGEAELRLSKEGYRFLFDENPQPMWIYDLSTLRFLAFNAAALRRYGFSAAEFREMSATQLYVPEQVEAFVAETAKTKVGELRQGLWRHSKKDGSPAEVEIAALGLVYAGRPASLVLANDVTAQRQLQKQMLQAQKEKVTAQIAGGVADRFSKLMASLETDTGSLAQEAEGTGFDQRLKRVGAIATCASGLTRQLLALVGRHPMQSQMLDLNKLIERQIDPKPAQPGAQIEVKRVYGENVPLVAGDPALVEQVLRNLVTNAREAMPNGGTLTLSTSTAFLDEEQARRHPEAHPGAFVCLMVSDNGCGMSPEIQSRLFEPFFTTKNVPKAAGLGLASVHGLVKQHGGWIEVSSQPGAGTTMTVFFPCGPFSSTPRNQKGADSSARNFSTSLAS